MLNKKKFINNKALAKWTQLIHSSDKSNDFLLGFIGVMEDLSTCFLAKIEHSYPTLRKRISDRLISNHILNHFCSDIKPMLIRAMVLYMHLKRKNNQLKGASSEDRYDDFIRLTTQPDYGDHLFEQFPLLKEQLEINLAQFQQTFIELLSRLHDDQDELITFFLANDHDYILSDLKSVGDKHHHGRTVQILTLSSRGSIKKILYKPHSISMDVAFQKFIAWYNEQTSHLKLGLMDILAKKDYGWCQFIEHTSCQSQEEVKQYYFRLGIWLMLSYLFRGFDIHAENIIAHGCYPYIVDYECFLMPYILEKKSDTHELTRFFVTSTCFLPEQYKLTAQNGYLDLSAIGADAGQTLSLREITWVDVGKDTMHAVRSLTTSSNLYNKPMLLNHAIDPLDYESELMKGFTESYHFILNNRDYLLSDQSPFFVFKNVECRVIFRDTSSYYQLLSESWHPALLMDPIKRIEYFDWLKKIIPLHPFYQHIIPSELNDLNSGNIPMFVCSTTGDTVYDSNGKGLKLDIALTGFDSLIVTMEDYIHEADLKIQQNLIINSYETLRKNLGKYEKPTVPAILIKAATISLTEIKQQAIAIAERELQCLIELQIENRGRLVWAMIDKVNDTWTPAFTDIYLYDGAAGIALAFAYASFLLKHQQYRAMLDRLISSLRLSLAEGLEEKLQGIGAYEGIGSLLYSFSAIQRLFPEENLKDDLLRLLQRMPMLIPQDQNLDIIGGVAGCIAVLMNLHDLLPKKMLMDVARQCVGHLLQQYPVPDQFPLFGNTLNAAKPLLGFSHGISGMLWAVDQFNRIEESHEVTAWIKRALVYERSQYNSDAHNWPDYRDTTLADIESKKFTFMTAWCHGAPGIGLAKADMLSHPNDEELQTELTVALNTTREKGFGGYQCLCHGDVGNLELFLVASQKDASLTDTYYSLAGAVLANLKDKPFYCGPFNNNASPGLMTGRAGIVYQLLRMAYPDIVPSLLLLK